MSKKPAKSAIYIPEELVTEILVRLPVKTLLICKSVCKTWFAIISNPCFTKSQLHLALINPTILGIKKWDKKSVEARLKEELVLDNPDSSSIRINSHFMPRLFSHTRFVSSYNGIICLKSIPGRAPGVYLWNPSVGQYKELPSIRLGPYSYSKERFGYDFISNDYKVVRILYLKPADVFLVVHVYSNNANSWREFKNPILKKLESNDRSHSIVVNGVLYLGNEDELITFDLHQEVLGLVSLPSFDKKTEEVSIVLPLARVMLVVVVAPEIGHKGNY
ncbi:F-box/kelch-repeat protein At3g06240-like [Apium graveolens]|uniref:F-box/kelch-repeat protein At3g06240-like n=1 Tax=Apium graveolens TaxID=4045 RepID=UPI003D79811C